MGVAQEWLLSMWETLGLMPSTEKRKLAKHSLRLPYLTQKKILKACTYRQRHRHDYIPSIDSRYIKNTCPSVRIYSLNGAWRFSQTWVRSKRGWRSICSNRIANKYRRIGLNCKTNQKKGYSIDVHIDFDRNALIIQQKTTFPRWTMKCLHQRTSVQNKPH